MMNRKEYGLLFEGWRKFLTEAEDAGGNAGPSDISEESYLNFINKFLEKYYNKETWDSKPSKVTSGKKYIEYVYSKYAKDPTVDKRIQEEFENLKYDDEKSDDEKSDDSKKTPLATNLGVIYYTLHGSNGLTEPQNLTDPVDDEDDEDDYDNYDDDGEVRDDWNVWIKFNPDHKKEIVEEIYKDIFFYPKDSYEKYLAYHFSEKYHSRLEQKDNSQSEQKD